MKISVRRSGVIALLVVLFACCIALVFSNVKPASADGITIAYENERVLDDYTYGSKLTVPNAMLKDDDTLYSATAVVVFPSGKTSTNKTITLDEAGVYAIEYKAIVEGKVIIKSVQFKVDDALYTVTGPRSSAYYGTHDLVPSKKGVVVSLASGDKFVYNRVIDLTKVTSIDKLFSFFVTPETVGQQDADKITVTFTDVYDPENYVNVNLKKYTSPSGGLFADISTYVDANAKDQPATSAVMASDGKTLYNGISYNLHKSFIMGWSCAFSLVGEPFVEYGAEEFYLSWDYSNRVVYGPSGSAVPFDMIIDLDDPAFFDNIWRGFTTGEVVMSISASNYKATKFNFVLTHLNNEDLTQNVYEDTDKPIIIVDLPKTIPNAIIGKPYRLFDATAFDAKAGGLIVYKNVYYNYGSSNKINVTVEDGAFIPEKNRLYTIEYSAIDYFGNVAKYIVEIRPLEATKELTVQLGDYATTGYAGQSINIPKAKVEHLLDSYDEKVEVVCGESKYTPAPGSAFQPLSSGTHKVTYTVWNYVEEVSVTYEIEVENTSKPAFTSVPVLPKYFIKGATYNVSLPEAYHFADGTKNEVDVLLEYANDGGSYKSADYKGFTVSANNKVSLKFLANNDGNSVEANYDIPVVDVNYKGDLSYPNYFKTNNAGASQSENGVEFTVTADNNSVEFINGVSLKEYSFAIATNEYSKSMDGVNVYLTNQADGNHVVKLTVSKTASGYAELRVNDGAAYLLSYVWGKDNSTLKFTVNYENKVVLCDNKEISFASNYTTAEDFCIYLSASAFGVDGQAKFLISQVGNQSFGSRRLTDRMEPIIQVDSFDGRFVIGDKVTIKPILVSDVLSTFITASVSVTMLNDEGKSVFVTSVDGIELKNVDANRTYEIEIEHITAYMVEYIAQDSFNNAGNLSLAINVADKTAPELNVDVDEDELVKYADVGDKIKIAKYEVSDDIDEEVTVLITVTYPDYVVEAITESSFIAETAGKYVITYYAYDSSFNYTAFSYTVIVEE